MALIFSIYNTYFQAGADATSDVGTVAVRWRNGYFSDTVTAGTFSATGGGTFVGAVQITGNIIGGASLTIGTGTIIGAKITGTTGSFTALLTAGTASISGAIIGGTTITGGTGSFSGNFFTTGTASIGGAIIGGTSVTAGTGSFSGNLFTGGTASVGGAIIGGTTLTVGTVSATGNIIGNTTASGYYLKEGANASMGTVTLVAGTANVATTKVTANSRIMLTPQATGTGNGSIGVSSRTAGTSFAVGSTNVLDDRVIAWLILEPA